MKNIFIILFFSLILLSCSDIDDQIIPACGVDNPIEDLAWLKEYILEQKNASESLSKYFFVAQGTYNGETVFVFDNCCPICNSVIPLYDCEGMSLGLLGDLITREDIKDAKTIYKPEGFTCSSDW